MEEKFNIDNYRQLLSVLDIYDEEACRIFEALRKADAEAGTKVLKFGKNSYVERIGWDFADKDALCITYYDYGYDLYDSDNIYIPIKIFGNDTLIEAWIKEKIQEELSNLEKKKEQQKSKLIAFELAEYERLKAKFENEQ